MRGTDGTTPHRGALALGAAAVAVTSIVALTTTVATAHDATPKRDDPEVDVVVEPTDLVVEHVEIVRVGRGEFGGVARATVRNRGAAPATGVELDYELGAGTTFDPARSTDGCTAPDTLVICPVGELAGGAASDVAIGLRVPPTTRIGDELLGVFREPVSDGWDAAAGELLGVDGVWRARFTPLTSESIAVCALDLPTGSEISVAPVGVVATTAERVLTVGSGAVRSRGVDVVAGTAYGIEVRLPAPGAAGAEGTPVPAWTRLGLVSGGEPCTVSSAAALGISGQWRARSAVRVVVAPGASLAVTGAVWGNGPTGRTASAAVENRGPDDAPVVLRLDGATARTTPGGGCVVAAGSRTATCSLGEVRNGATATAQIGITDGVDLGRWVATTPDD